MPKNIVFEVRFLGMGMVQARERVRATLKTWPEISEEEEWPRIQQKLQDVRRKRGWHCTVKFDNGIELEDLCDPSSLRSLLMAQHETLLQDRVEMPLYLFSDPTSGISSSDKEKKDIVFETKEQGSPIRSNLQSDLQLGEGGFGTVWRTTNGEGDIALKVASPNRRSQESMKTEIRTLLQLNHPNIIKVVQHGYVVDPDNGRLPAYMMDLCRCSVAALLKTGWHTKAAAEAARRDVGSALQHFHSAGLGHTDVKPGNLLVTNKCTAASGETQLTLTLIDAGGAGRLKIDKVTSFTAEYAHPLQKEDPWEFRMLGRYDKFKETTVEAFFDWYGLKASIFQLSNCSWDSKDGFPKDEKALAEASEALAKDKQFTLQAVQQNGRALEFASETFQRDKEVVMEAVRQNGSVQRFASRTLQSDKEVVMEAVRQYGGLLQFASEKLQSDKEVVMEAVRQNGSALQSASETLRSDKEVVMEAVRQNGFVLWCASRRLQNDKEVVMEAVRQDGHALDYASETLRSDKEVVMEAVRQDGSALQSASETLQRDKEVVMEAVRQNGSVLRFASRKFQSDKEVVMEAVRQNGRALDYASETLRSDKEVMEAVRQNGAALQSANETLVRVEALRQAGYFALMARSSEPEDWRNGARKVSINYHHGFMGLVFSLAVFVLSFPPIQEL